MAAGVSGCTASTAEDADDDDRPAGAEGAESDPIDGPIGQTSQSVAAEKPGKVEYAYRYYGNADIARAQFATPSWNGGCSSTMIGPNTVLTAAHCGPPESAPNQVANLTFMTYRANETERNTEMFQCRRLIHGWPRHDLAVAFCEPNAAGVNPGDKYGYLDVETRAPAVGDRVYSIWWNSVVSGATGNAFVPLYSAGKVTSTTATIWRDILGGPAGTNVGIAMDTWAQPGASGSSNIDANTHRILVGPTTLANSVESASRFAFSMRTYLDAQLLAPGTYNGAGYIENVKASNFPAGNYSFGGYVGKVDKSVNGVFDVQEDVERQRGENQRTAYWLGFDSRRRNQLWETGFVLMNYDAKETPVTFVAAGLVVRHRLLNLKPNTNYRVGVRVRTNSAGNANAVSVGFERSNQAAWSVAPLRTTAGTTVLRTGMLRTDANPKPFLAIRTTGAFNGAVSEIELIEDGTTTDFELVDQREGWTTSSGGRAHFLPRGVTSTAALAAPDFALWVRSSWFGSAMPVSTQKLLFVNDRTQRLCFKARLVSGIATGTARITSGGTQVLNASFPLTSSWTTRCYSGLNTPSSDTTLTFSSTGARSRSYLVDDVKLDRDPRAIALPPGGGVFLR